MMAPMIVEALDSQFARVAQYHLNLASTIRMMRSAISCGASCRMVTPTSSQPKLTPHTLKPMPRMSPSEKLWKKSPSSTGSASAMAFGAFGVFSGSAMPSSTDTPAEDLAFPSRTRQTDLIAKQVNHPPMRHVPHVQVPVTSSCPAPARCRPSGSSRKAAAAKITPEANELMKGEALCRALLALLAMSCTTNNTPRRAGTVVRKDPANTAPQSPVLLCSVASLATPSEHIATDTCMAGSTSSPAEVLK
mmetsp:Transcript_17570/g.50122  ORF Transcript_17570/g.50122 Transcript_17570/m.50122 type:complete len:248 (-) Transcript_17570:835-1578(-)